ncbi:Uncharacterised protein [Bordetella pertussis]|nr:Uncharacterised protein [Bordetella pertussis]
MGNSCAARRTTHSSSASTARVSAAERQCWVSSWTVSS